MPGVNETRFLVQHESCESYVIESNKVIMMNVGISVKNQIIEVLVKMIICGILTRLIVNVIQHVKLVNIEILKIVHVFHERLYDK